VTVAAIAMVKDECDIITRTVMNMSFHVDAMIVADNGSTDGTRDLLDALADVVRVPMFVLDDPQVGYEQSRKMTAMAHLAHTKYGASWIVPFDADEFWKSDNDRIADVLSSVHPSQQHAEAALFDYVATGTDKAGIHDPIARIQWRRRNSAPLPKVACRWHEDMIIEMGNHGVSYRGYVPDPVLPQFTIGHFPYRSPQQVITKIRNGAKAYAATNLPDYYGAHWRGWGRILDEQGEEAIIDLFHKWHYRKDPTAFVDIDGERQPPLVKDPIK
jgi:hypothetical protein